VIKKILIISKMTDAIADYREEMMELARELGEDYAKEFIEAYQDRKKWDEFCNKHNVKEVPFVKCPNEIENSGEAINFTSAEEQRRHLEWKDTERILNTDIVDEIKCDDNIDGDKE